MHRSSLPRAQDRQLYTASLLDLGFEFADPDLPDFATFIEASMFQQLGPGGMGYKSDVGCAMLAKLWAVPLSGVASCSGTPSPAARR